MVKSARTQVEDKIRQATADWASNRDIAHIRAGFEKLLTYPSAAKAEAIMINNMHGVSIKSASDDNKSVILYCHGGGFQIGSTSSHHGLMGRLSHSARMRVIGFNYRLAPEHRFPAAIEDCFIAYLWLLKCGYPPSNIAVAGDSAGGALAVSIALQAIQKSIPPPHCLVLLSPWLDLSLSGDSYTSRAPLDIFSKPEQLRAMARSYVGREIEFDDPRASPLYADLKGLPPTLIHAGDHDITLDDAKSFTRRAKAAELDVQLEVWPEMYHHFQVFEELPEAEDSLTKIGAYLEKHMRR